MTQSPPPRAPTGKDLSRAAPAPGGEAAGGVVPPAVMPDLSGAVIEKALGAMFEGRTKETIKSFLRMAVLLSHREIQGKTPMVLTTGDDHD